MHKAAGARRRCRSFAWAKKSQDAPAFKAYTHIGHQTSARHSQCGLRTARATESRPLIGRQAGKHAQQRQRARSSWRYRHHTWVYPLRPIGGRGARGLLLAGCEPFGSLICSHATASALRICAPRETKRVGTYPDLIDLQTGWLISWAGFWDNGNLQGLAHPACKTVQRRTCRRPGVQV